MERELSLFADLGDYGFTRVTTHCSLSILKIAPQSPEALLMRLPSFSSIRVTILLIVLLSVGFISLTQLVYTRNWNQTLQVTVFPINADGHLATSDYIAKLDSSTYSIIDRWAMREARRYDLDLQHPFKAVSYTHLKLPTILLV